MHSSVNKNESRTFFGHPYPLGSLFFTEMWERFVLRHPSFTDPVYGGDGVRRRHGPARENASAIVGIFAGSMYLARRTAAGWRITGLANNAPSGTALS